MSARTAQTLSASLPLRRLAALMVSASLVACGGGGGGSATTPPPPPPPPPATASISGVVSDGPLAGATACYDLNDNNACDAGEPTSAATDANGNYTVTVPSAAAGQHAVIVSVPANAVDLTTGAPIGIATTFRAPASGAGAQSVFVSPLTTLVVDQMAVTGVSATAAAAFLQAQAGLGVSPLADFGGNSAAQQQAARLARLVVLAHKQLATAMAGNLGQTDVSGAAITQADIDRAIASALRGGLPALAAAINDPAVSGATDLQAALTAAAQDLVASQPALNAAEALALVGAAKLPSPAPSTAPQASAVLRNFTYTDANNWAYRSMESSVADNTPDNAGMVRFYDVHKQTAAGALSTWGFGSTQARSGDLHWNGAAWVACALGARSSQTQRDASGRSSYDYCDQHETGISTRTALDIAGLTLTSVVTDKIRSFPGDDGGGPYANWGPTNLNLLGNAVFPAGSLLFYQTTQPLTNALAYDVTALVATWDNTVGAGGDARNNATLPCRQAFLGSLLQREPATLEEMAVAAPGAPCTVDPQTETGGTSLNPNIWWGGTSLSLGTVAGALTVPAGTGTFFTTSANLRVSFNGGGNGVTFHRCYQRTNGGSSRNCSVLGTGTYSIEQVGDARVMTFGNLPTLAQRLSFTRAFVERGGKVYFGYRSVAGITRNTLRLNLPAANAVFGQLGIAAINPQ